MHSCSEVPSASFAEDDNDRFEKIRHAYAVKSAVPLGRSGSFAVCEYATPRNEIIIKVVTDLVRAQREIKTACALNALRRKTPVFVHTLGYFIHRELLNEKWCEPNPCYVYIFTHKPEYEFLSTSEPGVYKVTGFTRQYVISLLFILFHGIYVARKKFGFVHNGICASSLMFARTHQEDAYVPFKLQVGALDYKVHFIEHLTPKLIDFGESRRSTKTNFDESRDLRDIVETLARHPEVNAAFDLMAYFGKPQYEKLFASKNNDHDAIAEFLADDPLFSFIERGVFPSINEACVVCGKHEAAYRFQDTAAGLCSPFCSHRIGPLAHFLPREDFIQ